MSWAPPGSATYNLKDISMKIAKTFAGAAIALLALTSFSTATAQSPEHGHHAPAAAASVEASLSDGEVQKVDKSTGRVTLKHGPLENLGMPGMTMLFSVKDPAALDTLKPGDKIKFVAEKIEGRFVISQFTVQP